MARIDSYHALIRQLAELNKQGEVLLDVGESLSRQSTRWHLRIRPLQALEFATTGSISRFPSLLIYLAGTVLELCTDHVHCGNAPTVARVFSDVGPLPVVVWQAMVVSGSWRWLTLAVSAIARCWFGRWFQALFGLDPPYVFFVLGVGLPIEGAAIGAAVATGFIASRISRVIRDH